MDSVTSYLNNWNVPHEQRRIGTPRDPRDIQTAASLMHMTVEEFCARMGIPAPSYHVQDQGVFGRELSAGNSLSNTEWNGAYVAHATAGGGEAPLNLGPMVWTLADIGEETNVQGYGTVDLQNQIPELPTGNLFALDPELVLLPSPTPHIPLSYSGGGSDVRRLSSTSSDTQDAGDLVSRPQVFITPTGEAELSLGSSLVNLTPASASCSENTWQTQESRPESNYTGEKVHSDDIVTPEEERFFAEHATRLGPCSKVWVVPKRTRRPRKRTGTETLQSLVQKRERSAVAKRGPFRDEKTRQDTADTRKKHACIRCRMMGNRCETDPADPLGVCLCCKQVRRPILCKLPCLRWLITDASLYREQDMPFQMFSRRWQSMDLVDMDPASWASAEVRPITVSQIFLHAPYTVRVREFVPVESDMVEQIWTVSGIRRVVPIPCYAIADIHEAADELLRFIERNIGTYINGAVGKLDMLIWETYLFSFRSVQHAKTEEERELILNCLRLWVGCRKTSFPEHIVGTDKLGGVSVNDPESPYFRVVPIPVIMNAQMECIIYTKVLRPKAELVLRKLHELVTRNKKDYWMTIYLTVFMLLHSCSMLTRRDWEYARQCGLKEEFANPDGIRKHQIGCRTILAHFHYLNKGAIPFSLTADAATRKRLRKAAALEEGQLGFVQLTAQLVAEHERSESMRQAREARLYGHDLYWVSQLYDENWEPGPTA